MQQFGTYYGTVKHKKKIKDQWYHKARRVLYSALIFTICYIAVVMLYQLILKTFFVMYGYTQAEATYNQLNNLPVDPFQWNRRVVTLIFGGVPVIFFILGIVFVSVLLSMENVFNNIRLVVLWLAILCFNLFYTSVIISPAGNANYITGLYNGYAVVAAWWYVKNVFLIPLTVLFITVTILTGLLLGFEFHKFSHSKSLLESVKGRNLFLTQTFLLPVLLGAIPLIMLTNKYSFVLHAVFIANLLLMGTGMYIRSEIDRRGAQTIRTNTLNRIPMLETIIALSLWGLVYMFYR
jgi:hypothetical protein